MAITEAYKNAVVSYALHKENYLFHNAGSDHALVIFENLFKNATSCIRIAAENLWNDDVVNKKEYINSLLVFLDKKEAILKILLTQFPEDKKKEIKDKKELNFYLALYNHPAYKEDRIVIKDGGGKSFKRDERIVHFCTADGLMYRMEDDIRQRSAIVNFCDKQTTKALEDAFDGVFDRDENPLKRVDLDGVFS